MSTGREVTRAEFDEFRRNFNELLASVPRSTGATLDSLKALDKRIDALEAWRAALTAPAAPNFSKNKPK